MSQVIVCGVLRLQFFLFLFLYSIHPAMAFDFSSGVFKYQLKMARNGHANSQYKLGVMYATGRGPAKDMLAAQGWLKKSAAQGHLPAKNYLVYLEILENGYDSNKHASWLKQLQIFASNKGSEAALLLGDMYKNGTGVKRDIRLARDYYKQAYSQGFSSAESRLEVVNNLLAEEQEKRLLAIKQKEVREKQQLEKQKAMLALKKQQAQLKKSEQLKQLALDKNRMAEKNKAALKRLQKQQKISLRESKLEKKLQKTESIKSQSAELSAEVKPDECDGPWGKHMLICN